MKLPFLAGGPRVHGDGLKCHRIGSFELGLLEREEPHFSQGCYREHENGLVFVARWREGCPTAEELYRGYQKGGASYVNQLRGYFVMAIIVDGTLHLLRDRAGGFSLYYSQMDDQTFFCTSPSWLHGIPNFKKSIDPGSLARYFTYSFQAGQRTMLKGVNKCAAASITSFSHHKKTVKVHYSHDESGRCEWKEHSSRDWNGNFRSDFEKSVSRCLQRGPNAGAFLSGGLDSSLIAAEVQRQSSHCLSTYALHFGKDYANELSFAKTVADHIGSDHHEIELAPEGVLEKLAHLVTVLDDPIGDPVTLGNFEMAQRVSHDKMFNGEGGDPCFGGPKNIPMMLESIYPQPQRQKDWMEQAYLRSYRRAYEEFPRLFSSSLLQKIDIQHDLVAPIRPYFNRQHDSMLRQLLELNQVEKGANLILPKVHQLQGRFGIEPLSPLFDEDLIHHSMTLPTSKILDKGIEKVILKEMAKNLLPREIIDRPKSGMRVPVYYWFKGPLRKYAQKLLSRKRIKEVGLFDADRVQQILKMDTEEKGARYGIWLWMLLTFEMWRKHVVENESL